MIRATLTDSSNGPVPGMPMIAKTDHDQRVLARFNHQRITPGLGETPNAEVLARRDEALAIERLFLEKCRLAISSLVADVPQEPVAFVAWFENLRHTGPGQNDALFPWLAT